MIIPGRADKGDIPRERNIPGDFRPHVVEVILPEPHVRAAAADGVSLLGRAVLDRSRVQHRADVLVILKDTQRRGSGPRRQRKR